MKSKTIFVVIVALIIGIISSNIGFSQFKEQRMIQDLTHKSKVEPEISANYFDDAGLDSFILDIMDSHHIAGFASCILKNDEIVWKRNFGYANVEENRMVTDSTLFTIASVSKTITATALMQLWEEELFDLDDNINEYLPPNLQIHNPYYPDEIITFKMLLTHTSSIQDSWDILLNLNSQGDSDIPLDTFLVNYLIPGGDYYSDGNFHNEMPGANRHYCNVAFGLIGCLVEQISNIPFDQYCQDNIFNPLEMNETAWFLSQLDTNNMALPCDWAGHSYDSYGHISIPYYPAGMLRTSTDELAKFLNAYMKNIKSNTESLLDSSTIKLMLSDQIGVGWVGLCWRYHTAGRIWGHIGEWYGVRTSMWFSPEEDYGFISFSNTGFEDNSWAGFEMIVDGIYYHAAFWDKIYAYEPLINRTFLEKDVDSLLVQAKFVNRQNHDFMAHAVIRSVDGTYTDSVQIYDDGQHGDSQSGDGIWGNYFDPISIENEFILMVNTRDLQTGDYLRSPELDRITTIGPIKYVDSFDCQLRIGGFSQRFIFKIRLNNLGQEVVAKNIGARVHLLSEDSCFTMHDSYRTFSDINPGEIVDGPQFYSINVDTSCMRGKSIYDVAFSMEIESDEYVFWTDTFTIDILSDITEEEFAIPKRFALHQNYPNPFNPVTIINYQLPMTSDVKLSIYNLLGQRVVTLVSEKKHAGYHQVEWDASGFSSGIYYYRIEVADPARRTGEFQDVKKMILLR